MAVILLTSCSDEVMESHHEKLKPLTPIGFGGIIPQDGAQTRTSFDVGGNTFWPYNELYPMPINKEFTTIGAFMTQDEGAGAGARNEYTSISGYFSYLETNSWETTVGVRPESYYIFGYMPSNLGSLSVTTSKRTGSWADGCVMHFKDLNTVTPADVCVVVGVLKATVTHEDPSDPESPVILANIDADPADPNDNHLTQGIYSYRGTEHDNYVYLLLDHLYTNVNLELSLDPNYATLRTIVLRQIKMKAKNIKDVVDVDVTLTNSPTSPIQNIQFPPDFTSSGNVDALIYPRSDEDGMIVSSDPEHPTSVPGYFAPGMTTASFEFEFHYDVYDKDGEDLLSDPEHPVFGNCVREGCIAVNKWTLPGSGVQNGKSFKVKATIKPTYLFMLSNPDLDNPTIELEN
ncbi:MAG: hypothetical protein KBT20_01435 [Bacteroidales bacterium]|nr:hypothetical protein [Candidatus Liminaster caballi]